MNNLKILVVDDEKNIVELIKMNLESSGYEVIEAYTGMEAITKTNIFSPDLIILDLMLPDIDGLQVCKMLKNNEDTVHIPIIMVTARSEETDKVHGLSMGADDYITKPFGISELEARIKTVLRRSENNITFNMENSRNHQVLNYKNLTLDTSKYEVMQDGKIIDFTLTEFNILKILMENGNVVSTRDSILNLLGADKTKNDSRTLDVHIRNTRKKLEHSKITEYIETIRGIGYKLK